MDTKIKLSFPIRVAEQSFTFQIHVVGRVEELGELDLEDEQMLLVVI